MNSFKNAEIVKSANIYFDGKVTSRTIILSNGNRKSLGIMLPGIYIFNTGKKELIEIISGDIIYKLKGSDKWTRITDGMSFKIPKDSSFEIEVKKVTDYCCNYLG